MLVSSMCVAACVVIDTGTPYKQGNKGLYVKSGAPTRTRTADLLITNHKHPEFDYLSATIHGCPPSSYLYLFFLEYLQLLLLSPDQELS